MKNLHSNNGITLLELLIATILTGLVFAVAMSVYNSSIKFMNIQGVATDPTQSTVVALEDVAKRISLCTEASVVGTTLHLTCDYAPGTYNLTNGGAGSPSDPTDDSYWHYGLTGGALRLVSNGPGLGFALTDPAGGAVVIPNVDTAASSIALSKGSGVGANTTKVDITIITSGTPVTEVRTSAMLGAKATR